jgi:hypothetical protein
MRAEDILDCKALGCEKPALPVLQTADASDGKDEVDRTAALGFFRIHLVFPKELGPDDRFVDGADLSLAPLDEIDSEQQMSGVGFGDERSDSRGAEEGSGWRDHCL